MSGAGHVCQALAWWRCMGCGALPHGTGANPFMRGPRHLHFVLVFTLADGRAVATFKGDCCLIPGMRCLCCGPWLHGGWRGLRLCFTLVCSDQRAFCFGRVCCRTHDGSSSVVIEHVYSRRLTVHMQLLRARTYRYVPHGSSTEDGGTSRRWLASRYSVRQRDACCWFLTRVLCTGLAAMRRFCDGTHTYCDMCRVR